MFSLSNLKKCLAEPDVQVPLDEIEIDENLRFVVEPIEIIQRDVKKLKRRRIPLVHAASSMIALTSVVSIDRSLSSSISTPFVNPSHCTAASLLKASDFYYLPLACGLSGSC
ncbi:hypothetical protein Tco_0857987 [Tanacetum coccineum]|uniref:Uncharacterized protein n=1 Tax=Tanacetum coccineum TaxID=301880 RepID=A0ABQ5B833_9ASTR